jgi:hypothetical protein
VRLERRLAPSGRVLLGVAAVRGNLDWSPGRSWDFQKEASVPSALRGALRRAGWLLANGQAAPLVAAAPKAEAKAQPQAPVAASAPAPTSVPVEAQASPETPLVVDEGEFEQAFQAMLAEEEGQVA